MSLLLYPDILKKNNFSYLAFNFYLIMFPLKEKIIKIIFCKKGMTRVIKS